MKFYSAIRLTLPSPQRRKRSVMPLGVPETCRQIFLIRDRDLPMKFYSAIRLTLPSPQRRKRSVMPLGVLRSETSSHYRLPPLILNDRRADQLGSLSRNFAQKTQARHSWQLALAGNLWLAVPDSTSRNLPVACISRGALI